MFLKHNGTREAFLPERRFSAAILPTDDVSQVPAGVMTKDLLTCLLSNHTRTPRAKSMADSRSVVLASLVTEVRGVMFYEFQECGASWGDRVTLVRRPDDHHDVNCVDVRFVHGMRSFLLCHLAAEVAAHLSPLLCDVSLGASG